MTLTAQCKCCLKSAGWSKRNDILLVHIINITWWYWEGGGVTERERQKRESKLKSTKFKVIARCTTRTGRLYSILY
jgi:hypothetical protein